MANWRIPKRFEKQTWSVITYPDFHVVVPTWDTKPHEVESMTCACNPRNEIEGTFTFVVHESWQDKERIAESLKKIIK